jgi:ribose/xylose/arabinose/galactoside ABC-type transport system permease subunit
MTEMQRIRWRQRIRDCILGYGFIFVMILVFIIFTFTSRNFLTLTNIMSLLHASTPLLIITSGLGLVMMMGKLDISVGAVGFFRVDWVRFSLSIMVGIPFLVSV